MKTFAAVGYLANLGLSCSYYLNYRRTSDSLNEGLPIKIARQKFKRKRLIFHQKDSRLNCRMIRKSIFLIGQVPFQKYGLKTLFLLFNIYKIEKVLLKCFPPPPPVTKTNPFAHCCSFTFHTSYKNGMIGHGGERCQNAQKQFIIKTY